MNKPSISVLTTRWLALAATAATAAGQGTCLPDSASLLTLGSPSVIEDFESFLADESFEAPNVLATQFGALTAFGGTGFRNMVDVPPLLFGDNDGSANASCFINALDPGGTETLLRLNFVPPARAIGIDVYAGCGFECVELRFFLGGALVGTCPLTSNALPAFIGHLDPQCFDALEIVSQTPIPGPLGQGFGIDNIRVYHCPSAIGTPSALCTPVANSAGLIGVTRAVGTMVADQQLVTLIVENLPPGQFGYLIAALTPANFMPLGSNGFVCIGPGGIGRYNAPGQVMQGPMFQVEVGSQSVPTNPAAPISAGDTWYWQCWHRDVPAGGQLNNFTGAVGITFQ